MFKLKLSPRHGDAQATLTTLSQLVNAQAERHRLGDVLETSCIAASKKAFDQGMLSQHSFWCRVSKMLFEDMR
jgi:hypothetical protein